MRTLSLPILALAFLCACTSETTEIAIGGIADIDSGLAVVETPEEPVVEEGEYSMETITFTTSDGLEVTADWHAKGNQPAMLLCHQAGWSRGEYINTAKTLVDRGFNCLALDQRSGGDVNGIKNETFLRAQEEGWETTYIDAVPDLLAGLDYAYDASGQQPVIIVGSSYSSSLVLKVGSGNEKVRAVLSFSPGEYFQGESVAEWASGINVPVFITSSKDEATDAGLLAIIGSVQEGLVTHFIPEGDGYHGARALFTNNEGNEEYWAAVNSFLDLVTH